MALVFDVECVARGLYRAAGYDPDALVDPSVEVMSRHAEPLDHEAPTWHRFRGAAEAHADNVASLTLSAGELEAAWQNWVAQQKRLEESDD